MTIVLGRRPAKTPTPYEQNRAEWLRHFADRPVAVSDPETPGAPYTPRVGGPAPVPVAEIRGANRGIYTCNKRRRNAAPGGQVGLYAARMDALEARRLSSVTSSAGAPLRSIGRGCNAHYETLYPNKNVQLPQVHVEVDVRGRLSTVTTRCSETLRKHNPWTTLRSMLTALTTAQAHRLSYSRRAMLASMAALVLMAGMATSTLAAGQMRYEVQEGDTLDSIATDFGVDREAIYRASWMPNGYTVEAGQVIIIPEPGQSPDAAAAMAAEREGTSPWVADVHVIVWGDTFYDIATTYGVTIEELRNFNPDVNPANLIAGERLLIPVSGQELAAAPEQGPVVEQAPTTVEAPVQETVIAPTSVRLPVPNYGQTRNLSCEFAATYAATAAFGPGLSEEYLINAVPKATNPHLGYRGNIDGEWGNTTDYGVYAGPLVPVLEANGYNAEAFYSGGDVEILKEHLDQGRPVVVWLGFWGDTRERLNDDGQYSVFSGMHAVTVIGYDEDGVLVMDPAKGATVRYDWDTFSEMWAIIDGMGLAIWPKE